ncbi:MAG: endonuclease NucS [Methanosarcinaceae archaeon]|nr:endonuclease NucS [Methanosarcinaceae archaeon]
MNTFKYYIRNDTPFEVTETVRTGLEEIGMTHQSTHQIVCLEDLDDAEQEQLLETIRIISRKNGMGVVSKGRGPLPISRKHNLSNVGILIQFKDDCPVDVYPHVKNGKRNDVLHHLKHLVEASDMDALVETKYIREEDIARMIATFPELIEDGLQFNDTEIEIEGGRIDAVFTDMNEKHLLVEIEITARDNAIGQVQRFKLPYARKFHLDPDQVRLAIVCAKISESRLQACKGSGIDVHCLCLDKRT